MRFFGLLEASTVVFGTGFFSFFYLLTKSVDKLR